MKTENEINKNQELVDIDAEINKLVNKTLRKISYLSDEYEYEERALYSIFMERMRERGFWIM
ncbi:MAG: hypothetical protein CSA15_06630 [Candidatus Delongbacteria bacterium]|nr:MAG: hypothetical protein CSA15_06630 [Candidatus Delongbacteria bacterium]